MKKTIVFVHGMFQTSKSWDKWVEYFTQRGYNCVAPSWPGHEGEPAELRAHPHPDLGELSLDAVVSKIEEMISALPEKPIVIGHSVGGLIVQLLSNKAMISLGVPISSVAPNMMMSLDWDFFKNSISITNPLKGDKIFEMTPEGFHESFANTLSEAESKVEYEKSAVHDSRNVLRDSVLEAKVDLDLPHVPLLFISGEKDHIIPHELVEKNAKAYNKDGEGSMTTYRMFPNRSHYICGETGWQEVAEYIYGWLQQHEGESAYQSSSASGKEL